MNNAILERIVLRFPNKKDPFPNLFAGWIKYLWIEKSEPPSSLKRTVDDRTDQTSVLELKSSEVDFYPTIGLDLFAKGPAEVCVDFSLVNGETFSLPLENVTGESWQSPHVYSYLPLDEVIQRFTEERITLAGIDHAGCNLPWFKAGLHPQITWLRGQLLERCLYHQFPTGEAWDFIIPGEVEEICLRKPVDYSRIRRPKFEIVSFEKSSIPLVQFDIQLHASYETLLKLFPEALNDPDLRNLWIYLENPYPIDVCIVANEFDEKDWSKFFRNSRLTRQDLDQT